MDVNRSNEIPKQDSKKSIGVSRRSFLAAAGAATAVAATAHGREFGPDAAPVRYPEPDVVVLDFYLPDGTGLDLLERIRGHAHTEHIPVIITTADFELEGAFFKGDPLTTFVHKPIDQTAFALAIDAALGFAEFVPPTPRPAS